MIETMMDAIKAAVADNSTAETRAAGAAACRTLLAVLDAKAGEPIAQPAPTAPAPSSPVAAIATTLRGVPLDQLADLLIAKLRTLVPPDAQASVRRMHIPFVAPQLKAPTP